MGMQPNYAILDGAALGPNLEIQDSGLVLTCNTSGISGASRAKCRGNIPKIAGKWQFELGYYGVDIATALILAGICTQNSVLTSGTGVDGSSYGYAVPDGGIYQGGTLITACAATPPKTYVQVCADLDNSILYIYSSGGLIATQAISAASATRLYYPSFTVGSDAIGGGQQGAYGLSLFVNFGQRAFAYPIPGFSPWATTIQPPPAVYLGAIGDQAYSSGAFDSPANQNYDPAILNLDTLEIDKSGTVWMWTDQSDSGTYSYFDIDNSFGKYWFLLQLDYRDYPVYYRQLTTYDDTLANVSHTVATCLVDMIEEVDERTIRVHVKDKLASDNVPLQRRIFPPWADPGVVDRPVPIIVGAARSVDVGAYLVDSPSRTYQLSDSQITNIGALRDRGISLDPNATPPGFVETNDMQGVVPQTPPVGLFTADVSSQGTQNTYPGVPDVLGGIGSNWDTAWTAGTAPPPGWTLTNTGGGGFTSTAGKFASPPHNMITMVSNRPISAIGGGTEFSFKPAGITPLRAGKTYKISVTLWDYQSGGTVAGSGLCVMSAQVGYLNGGQWISPYLVPLAGSFHADFPYTFVYTVPAGADRDLYFTVVAAGGASCSCTFRNIIVEELAQTVTNVPLVGSGFANYYNVVYGQHGGLAASEWSASDCAALDIAYPGSPLGVQIAGTMNRSDAARMILDSICGTIQVDRLGTRRIRRLVDPSTVTPLATYDETSIDYPILISPDYAKGLTQTLGYQRNWKLHADSDFASDQILLPPAFRTQLKRNSRYEQVCNVQLRNAFQFAALSGPLDMLFDNGTIALAEMVRILSIYSYQRTLGAPRFIQFTINYAGTPPEYLFGDVVGINYTSPASPLYSFVVQQNVAVVATKLMLGKQKLTILGWG